MHEATFRGDATDVTVSPVTGRELRELLRERGLTPTQFTSRYADAMVESDLRFRQERGVELSQEDIDRRRKSAVRTAKRWLSAKNTDRHLKMMTGNRAVVARVVGIDERRLDPPTLTYDVAPPGRLEELAGMVADAMEEQKKLKGRVDRLQARVRKLEARHGPASVDPTRRAAEGPG